VDYNSVESLKSGSYLSKRLLSYHLLDVAKKRRSGGYQMCQHGAAAFKDFARKPAFWKHGSKALPECLIKISLHLFFSYFTALALEVQTSDIRGRKSGF